MKVFSTRITISILCTLLIANAHAGEEPAACVPGTAVAFFATGAAQTYTVDDGVTQVYLELSGGSGGQAAGFSAGLGARISSVAPVSSGSLTVIVGTIGADGPIGVDAFGGDGDGGGGGGGTFIFSSIGETLLAAVGGGGGAGITQNGFNAALAEDGVTASPPNGGVGGTSGSGGDGALNAGGGGGAGFLGNGGDGASGNIGLGGSQISSPGDASGGIGFGGNGGFGGGGGGSSVGGGGGGGYSGGGGGYGKGADGGGGGGSYVHPDGVVLDLAIDHSGNGTVLICDSLLVFSDGFESGDISAWSN